MDEQETNFKFSEYLPIGSEGKKHTGMYVGTEWVPAVDMNQDVKDVFRGIADTLYPAVGGGYTRHASDAATSFDWDNKTGTINVSAPQVVLDSNWFKTAYAENDNFKALALALKADPTGTTSLTTYDKDGNAQQKTIQEMMEDQQKAFEDYSNQYRDVLKLKEQVAADSGGGIKLSDEDAYIYAHSTNRNDDRNNENEVVYIPNIASGYFDFTTIPSWNSENHTISAKDFYTWYNLDDGTENKDEMITKLTDAAIMMINQYNRAQAYLDPETRDDKTVANDYARTVSFLRTLTNDNPEANIFTSTRLFFTSLGNSLVDNLFQATGNTVMFVGDFIEGLDNAADTITPLKLISQPLKFVKGLYQTGEYMFYDIGSDLAGIDRSRTINQMEELATIGEFADAVADGDATGLLDTIEKNSGLSRAVTARDLLVTGHNFLLDASEDMRNLSSAATAGMIVGGIVGEVMKQVYITNPIGKAAENAYMSLTLGRAATAAMTSSSKVADVLVGMNVVKEGLSAKALAGAVKLGAVTPNLVAQGFSDTILNDEYTLRRMFLEGDVNEAIEAVDLNITFNAIGELTGLATSKGWDLFTSKTAVGQAVQAWGQRRVASIQYRKQRAIASIADKLNKLKSERDKGAEWMARFNREVEASASERIAHAGKYAKEGETITQATQRLVNKKIELEVAFTRTNTQTSRTKLEIQSNPNVKPYFDSASAKAGKVIQLEHGLGLSEKGAVQFTKETSNYIGYTKRLQYFSHKEDLSEGEEIFKKALEDKVSDFRGSHSTEFITAVDDYMNAAAKFYHEFNTWRAANGYIDADELKKYRASGLWGDDGTEYMHLQTLNGAKSQLENAGDLVDRITRDSIYHVRLETDSYHYKPGDIDAQYMDPQLVMTSEIVATAKLMDGMRWGDTLVKNQPYAREIDTNGKPVSNKELNDLLKEARNAADDAFKDFRVEDEILNYDIATAFKAQDNIPGKIEKKKARVDKLLEVSDAKLKSTALDLDPIDIQYLRVDMDLPEYLPLRNKSQLDRLYDSFNPGQKKAVKQALGKSELTLKNYNDALRNSDLGDRLVSEYLAANNELLKSKPFKDYALEVRRKQLTARQQTILRDSYKKIRELQKTAKLVEVGEDAYTKTIVGLTEDLTHTIMDNLSDNKVFQEGVKRYTAAGIDETLAKRYMALDSIRRKLGSNSTEFKQMLEKNLSRLSVSGNLTTRQKIKIYDAVKDSLKDNVQSELNEISSVLQKSGSGEILDTTTVFEDIRTYMKDIIDKEISAPNVIRVLDDNGQYKLYEVSPTIADLYTTRPNFSNIKTNGLVKFFNKTNRIFRLMTTGWSLSSFENQWLRDPLDAYVRGGLTKGLNANAEELGRLIGPNLTEDLKVQLDEMGWGKLVEDLPEGADVGKIVSEKVRENAELFYGGASEETKYFRQMDRGYKETMWGKYEKPVNKAEKALEWMEEHSPGNFRETYLRKADYVANFNRALDKGMPLKEAANWAEFVADNATTDFSRAFAWGNKIVASVPYLGAAINGTKSFWRLLEIDPVGVAGRFMSGIVFPTMALVGQSLADEENRNIYRNIPEYMKEDNIVFVVDGEVFKIPIPQELSAFVAPFRQVVEKAYDASDESWSELLLSDVLGMSPIDLSGLADLDDPLGKDADFWSRLTNEGEQLISQISPVAVKTAYMLATGRDPYTHSSIDKEYTWINSEGNLQVMDNEDSAIAKWFSDVCRSFSNMTGWKMFDLSPSAAEAILSSFFGQASTDLFNSMTNIFSGNIIGVASVYGKQIAKPFTAKSYDQNNAAWREVVKELQAEKQALMTNNGDLAKLSQQLMYETDPVKQKNLRSQIRSITQVYQDKVFKTVQKFNSIYGADYDYRKFASTINLLNFTNNASFGMTDAAMENARELASDNKNAALMTMSEMGFNSTNDSSIFGYLKRNNDGSVEWKATLPTAIAYMQSNPFYTGLDETVAKLNNVLTRSKVVNGKTIKEAYQDMWTKANAYANAGNWDARDKVFKDWDITVMTYVYPILSENDLMDAYGNNILDNKQVIDLLDDYIRVPSDAMGKGKYLSSSSGIDKNRGYAKSYIQKIYKQINGGK